MQRNPCPGGQDGSTYLTWDGPKIFISGMVGVILFVIIFYFIYAAIAAREDKMYIVSSYGAVVRVQDTSQIDKRE